MESKQQLNQQYLPADFVMDNAKMMDNIKLFSFLESTERLVSTDMVKKFSPCHFFKKDRMLVFTTQSIYNVKKDKLRRKIPLSQLIGITKSMLGSKDDFVLHFKDMHDYRYLIKDTNQRKDLIDVVKRLYAD